MKRSGMIIGKAWCNECNEEVSVVLEDNGIGRYEFWGAVGNHHSWEAECSVCGSPIDDIDIDEVEDSRDYGD